MTINTRAALSAIIDDLEVRCPYWTGETMRTNRPLVIDLYNNYVIHYGIVATDEALKILARCEG